ncbi:MAG: glycerol-3-phosphate dehydrogenase, partial [Chloroflexi bacterium]|nr:glycerol-3-phosphate dehydrogenase [Chloroflexota bacterium]
MTAAHRAVVGAGAWGTTLALMLALGGPVTLLARVAGHARQMVEKRH